MRIQPATLVAAAAAVALVATGCGTNDTCSEETPPISEGGVPDCTAAPGTLVQVPIRVCPECDQGPTRCEVHLEHVGDGFIQLEPLSEVCDPDPGCPVVVPRTCEVSPVVCTFTAPAQGNYRLVVITPQAEAVIGTLDVTGGPFSCSFL